MRNETLILCLLLASIQAWPLNKWANEKRTSSGRSTSVIPRELQSRGAPVLRGELPHHVTIVLENSRVCSGSLVSPQAVLTSAQCVQRSSAWSLHVGSGPDLQLILSSSAVHGEDIALIFLPQPIILSSSVRVVDVAPLADVVPGGSLIVAGVGTGHDGRLKSRPELRVADVTLLAPEVCADVVGRGASDVVCLASSRNQLPCNGDSGSAVLTYLNSQLTQVGVVTRSQLLTCELGYPELALPLTPARVQWITAHVSPQPSISL